MQSLSGFQTADFVRFSHRPPQNECVVSNGIKFGSHTHRVMPWLRAVESGKGALARPRDLAVQSSETRDHLSSETTRFLLIATSAWVRTFPGDFHERRNAHTAAERTNLSAPAHGTQRWQRRCSCRPSCPQRMEAVSGNSELPLMCRNETSFVPAERRPQRRDRRGDALNRFDATSSHETRA